MPSTGLRVRLLPSSLCLCFVFIFGSPGFCSFSLPPPFFSHKPLGARMCNIHTHSTRHLRSQYLGASLPRSLSKTSLMPKTCVMLPHEPFTHHYMHRYDLSFGQAGLPGSCAYPHCNAPDPMRQVPASYSLLLPCHLLVCCFYHVIMCIALHTCSSHASEHFPRCPFCNLALLCPLVFPFRLSL